MGANGTNEPVWSVSAVNRAVKETLEGAFMPFWMGGEVGSLLIHRSGHAYFQMKDEKSQIKVCWFGGAQQCRALGVENGSVVEVFGNLSVYDVRGEYQFSVKKLRLAGIGTLQQRFEELKRKLEAEGLFDPAKKKPIPVLPRKIGVVSSPSGAAIRDFLQIINRRFPNVEVKIFPAQVQGAGAAEEVARGVEFFNRPNQADVIVVTRGGGSMEDLWCFNEEVLARSIAASRVPVISAVGHEIDFTICDFVADLRVPTPSAAAELVIGRHDEITLRVDRLLKDMRFCVQNQLQNAALKLQKLSAKVDFYAPHRQLDRNKQYLDELELRLESALKLFHVSAVRKVDNLNAALTALDPTRQLERGYAMVFEKDGRTLVSSSKQEADKELKIRFADGTLEVKSL
jgi:exodeoxyribonuclease VII large subunit